MLGGALPSFPGDDDAIPIDDAVRIGTFENGLTYYIRENGRPGGRAQLRLVIKAGSVLEDSDQPGAAHFVEHMMFNGTERFPKNELVRVLQRFGAEFGPEINAFTSYDETVYELELPTDQPGILSTGLDVLAEWASRATLAPDEVDAERGILVEEWRLRSQRTSGRYFDGVTARLLGGTAYEERGPLADPEEVANITAEALGRFYDEWYRPSLMAVVAVGDFDAAEVLDLIETRFSETPDRGSGRTPIRPTTEAAAQPSFFVLADPEVVSGFIELNYPLPSVAQGTVGAAREELALGLGFDIVVTRLQEDVLRGDVAFFDASFAANPLVNAQRSPGTAAFADTADVAVTAWALLTETERALRHGFTQDEVDRAIDATRRGVEQEFESRATKQDIEFAQAYVQHFLTGAPIAGASDTRDLLVRLLDDITVGQLEATFRATVGVTEPLVIIVAPEAASASLPTELELMDLLTSVKAAAISPRADTSGSREVLMDRPEPAAIVAQSPVGPLGEVVLELENGAVVVLLVTDIAQEFVSFGAVSRGGWSIVPDADIVEAQLVSLIVSESGVGLFDQVDLERFLEDKAVGVAPFIDETEEGIFGQAATDDLEVMLQLVHLYATMPRAEQVALDLLIDELRPLAAAPDTIPDLALSGSLLDARYRGDSRYQLFPPVAEIDTFDLERALEVYRERFASASDFVYVFAGDFDLAEMAGLAGSYLGTLPGGGDAESFADIQPDPPPGIVERVVEAGSGELAGVTHLWSSELDLDPVTRLRVELLELLVQQRLTETIRERLSVTYSPILMLEAFDEPVPSVDATIEVSADPERLDQVADAVLGVIADIRAGGPTADELAIAKEQLIRNLELVSNEELITTLLFYAQHPEADINDEFRRFDRIQATTIADLEALARIVFPAGRYIEARLVPEGFGS
ncbi:MAG: M16 family metallopeptidase [Acidimicrobiia bacterium]